MRTRMLFLVSAVVAAVVCVSPTSAGDPAAHAQVPETGAKTAHQEALKALAIILPRDNLSHHPLDDEIARRWLHGFIDALDPQRLYFTAGDVQRFARRGEDLADHARRGDLAFAEFVRNVHAWRLGRTAKWGDALLNQNHDFTVDEHFELRPAEFAADVAALRQRWRKRIKYDILVEKSAGHRTDKALAKLRARYRRIARDRQIGNAELYEIFLDSLARAYGPNNAYLGQRSLQAFRL